MAAMAAAAVTVAPCTLYEVEVPEDVSLPLVALAT
jgi:hypothetical protein